jgi:hypothetical protein
VAVCGEREEGRVSSRDPYETNTCLRIGSIGVIILTSLIWGLSVALMIWGPR